MTQDHEVTFYQEPFPEPEQVVQVKVNRVMVYNFLRIVLHFVCFSTFWGTRCTIFLQGVEIVLGMCVLKQYLKCVC